MNRAGLVLCWLHHDHIAQVGAASFLDYLVTLCRRRS